MDTDALLIKFKCRGKNIKENAHYIKMVEKVPHKKEY